MPPLVILPRGPHTATAILLHGLGGDVNLPWRGAVSYLLQTPGLEHVKWIIPQAPSRGITINQGMVMPAWYDILSMAYNRTEDEPGMLESVHTIDQLVLAEVNEGIDPSRIILGGISQGAALSMLTGLTIDTQIGGLVVFSGRLPLQKKFKTMVSSHAHSLPVFWGHGTADNVVPIQYGRDSAQFLTSEIGMKSASDEEKWKGLLFKTYEGLGHDTSLDELSDLKDWLVLVVPPVEKL